MNPDLEMVARAMVRAMEEAVIPALPQTASFALENAMLVVTSLKQILEHADQAYAIALEELRLEVRELRRLRAILQSLEAVPSDAQQEAEVIEKCQVPSLERLIDLRARLRMENEHLVRRGLSAQSAQLRREIGKWSLDFSEAESRIPQMYRS